MRRGFKADAARLAQEVRAEFGLAATDRFDPYFYFSAYGIPVIEISALELSAGESFQQCIYSKISGALIPNGSGFVVLDNDFHPLTRRRSTAAHECAHHILEHEFAASLSTNDRACGLSAEQEAEAEVLAGELLLPSEATRIHALSNCSDQDVADAYGVSIQFAKWRLNASGARKFARAVHRRRTA